MMNSLTDIASHSVLSLEQLVRIEEYILNTGYMTAEKTREEMKRFIIDLGIDDYYFKTTSPADIARHLLSFKASEVIATYGNGTGIQLLGEQEGKGVYIVEDEPEKVLEVEERIDARYPNSHLESYITKGGSQSKAPLRFYIITKPDFPPYTPGEPRTFENSASAFFLSRAVPETIGRYKKAWAQLNDMETPLVSITYKKETDETRIMIGLKGLAHRRILPTLAHLLSKYQLPIRRKYVEPFGDEKLFTSLYLPRISDGVIADLTTDLNVALMLPENPVTDLFYQGTFGPQTTMYALSAAAFTHQFLSLLSEEYQTLQRALKDQPEARGIVDTLKLHLIKDTYSTYRIASTVIHQTALVEQLFNHFQMRFLGKKDDECEREEGKIHQMIEREVPSAKDRSILEYFLVFNKTVQRTNFFKKEKTCMVFKLDPSIVSPVDFPEKPFGLFFLAGHDFIGFHMRFRDIARGGIRIVRSRSLDIYSHNVDTIFTENYNLAMTQQRKNKDIPEGGAKGTILLNLASQNAADRAFKDYVDGLLDLLLDVDEKGNSTVKEILFLGPDEGSAPLMDWAALHAQRRGYPFWKSFSTGKAPELGGIPHDLYGMTTIGIHEYVLGLLEKVGKKEEDITKIQTGGPDGDLGSNEILLSKDKTIIIIDGSGVLYDPLGLNRKELVRLAKKRVMVQEFDRKLLSKQGFFVSINDRDVKLPDGEIVVNGEDFRNTFHLSKYAVADLFVPCGGRPGAINIGNWRQVFDDRGQGKFRYIVEGANLFITEEARLRLEEQGLVILKDASTNKGGVTSSSFEVFASLAMSDEEFNTHLRAQEGGVLPPFRTTYVEEIITMIRSNARSEFEILWREHGATGVPLTLLSNALSGKINQITDSIRASTLAGDRVIREKILTEYTPPALLNLLGLQTILNRVPDSYLRSIVATKMATDFVYRHGLGANEVDFADFVTSLKLP